MICSEHEEEKKMFCRSDQQLICHPCVDQHKDHDIVSAAAERREREKDVDQSRGRIQQKIRKRKNEVELLQQEKKYIRVSADQVVKTSQETLHQMIQILQRTYSDVEQQVRSLQETEAAQLRGLQEQEISELKKKEAELQQLLLTDSHILFLQNWTSLSEVSEDTTSSMTLEQTHRRFEEVTADLLRDTWTNISLMIHPEREQFLTHSQDITLDPNTAQSWLMLSEGNKKVTNMGEHQPRPDHPDRFINYRQVLSQESLTGRCYWEVKIGEDDVVAVSYKNISRSGYESIFGFNDKSWRLFCRESGCSLYHNNIKTFISRVRPSTVGVYLDHSAGLLSFYSVSETMTLLHRVQTRFTEPLHAGVYVESSCEFVKLK